MIVIRTRNVSIQNLDINANADVDLKNTIMEKNAKVCFGKQYSNYTQAHTLTKIKYSFSHKNNQ